MQNNEMEENCVIAVRHLQSNPGIVPSSLTAYERVSTELILFSYIFGRSMLIIEQLRHVATSETAACRNMFLFSFETFSLRNERKTKVEYPI